MTWLLTGDPDEYLAAAGAFLASDPVANTIPLVAADRLRAQGGVALAGSVASAFRSPLFGWWREADASVAGAFLHSPPYPPVLTSMTRQAAAALAGALAARARARPGRPGIHPAAIAGPWLRGRRDVGGESGRARRRRARRGAVHRLANATSNALYQRIGYRPVADRVEWSFGPRHRPTAEGT
jgi:hypothetical protein